MPYPGEILAGYYQIVDEIGSGGAGIIYRAYHLNLQKYVVVKKIKENFAGVLNARGEVDILKELHHTCLPQVYDFIQIGNEVYTVMDYIVGHDLKYYIDNQFTFDEEILWNWLMQLCDVLDYLHTHGILHLDIKPANIMLTDEGMICLIDFNISLSGGGDVITGISETYASPEQYRKWKGMLFNSGEQELVLDGRTDIYSLGASFYHMMTGYAPAPEAERMIPITEFALTYSDALVHIVNKMMQPNLRKRYADAKSVLSAVRHCMRSKAEKNTLRLVFGIMLAAVTVMAAVSGILFYRSRGYVSRQERASIQDEEMQLADLNSNGNYKEAYQEGAAFLNREADALSRLEGARQSILEQVVEACIGMEAYDDAQVYIDELLKEGKEPEYYQDAAVIAAYNGDFSKAEEYLETAKTLGGDAASIQMSQAELNAAKGNYVLAVEQYQKLYEEKKDNEILRRMAALYLKVGMDIGLSETEAVKYLSQAADCYEQLSADGLAVYADKKNLAAAYLGCGKQEQGIALLEEMAVDYPDQYEIFRDLSVLLYNKERKKAAADRNYTKVKTYAKKAEQLYKSEPDLPEDELLENILDIADALP